MHTETFIHPLAVVEGGAQLGAGVHVGPFCHVGAEVSLGEGTRLISHVAVSGATSIGSGCTIHPQAALGGPPQNNAHKGGRTTLTIGNNCTIREYVTIHVGTDNARGATTIGNNCTFLTYTHVGHDCSLGNNITMAAGAMLAGHVELGDNVGIGGLTGVHQFVRVGRGAFLAGGSMVIGDVLPFTMAMGNRAKLRGLNIVGLRRSGMSRSEMLLLRRTYKTLFDRSRPVSENIEIARNEFAGSPIAMEMVNFIAERGKRLYTVPPVKGAVDDDADDQD